MASLVGGGHVSRRYGPRAPRFAGERWFTLCNLAVRRRSMLLFASSLVCAEENALPYDLRAREETMRYDASLRAFHARRARSRPSLARWSSTGAAASTSS